MNGVRTRGFTLIELLVVLVIIGAMLTAAVVTLADPRPQQLEREARRLATVLELAAEEAVLRSEILGVYVERDEYAFARYGGSTWTLIEDDTVLRPHSIPESIYLTITVDGWEDDDEEAGDLPQILLMNSGEIIPFEIRVNHEDLDAYFLIEGHLDGRFVFHNES